MSSKKMLITGGAGFIGVNSAKHFLNNGWEVVIFDNFSRQGTDINRKFLEDNYKERLQIVVGDIRTDQEELNKLCEECDIVLHLAAQVAVTTSVVDPREDFEINALGTFNVLEAVRQSSKKPAIIYASTNKVYGGLEDVEVAEGDIRYTFAGDMTGVSEAQLLDFHSPYGCSKGSADQYVRDYSRLYDLKTVVLRQSCIYGPHQMGVEDQGWVAWFMIAALYNKPVQIYGNGKQVRDVLYVDDLVNCYDACIKNMDKVSGEAYNIGGGKSNTMSLLEFMDLLNNEMQMPLHYTFSEVRPGDQPIFISDNSKFMEATGWNANTGVREGIVRLLEWLQESKDILSPMYEVKEVKAS
ncbi:MAG: SDR family NAD(P)-dependent oxidoreductase [Candidatus Peribacteraceae bacterium]|jgi:CDP-paratose 2-epimerase|nr:SDR family NAD(P)-dependent oxidoreductase [Candidatus Peribacteraceae bacterium]